MKCLLRVVLLTACLVGVPGGAGAQTTTGGDVTFRVPLNLTRISPDIATIVVACRLESAAIGDQNGQPIVDRTSRLDRQQEFPVTGGQVITTATIVFSIPSLVDPSRYPAIYGCRLLGITKSGMSGGFSATSTDLAFRLSPTPAVIEGTFTW